MYVKLKYLYDFKFERIMIINTENLIFVTTILVQIIYTLVEFIIDKLSSYLPYFHELYYHNRSKKASHTSPPQKT